ncbi:hypothetical protein BGZ76_011385 [Entomortierella beljakovae]|nr:hypothetical protein BGZ76_011385 [Entomortierella beljakovae]
MSSEYAEFLFSFAWNKLESSPQLDLRQQLLHSNLIRHILLVHQQSNSTVSPSPTTTTSTADSSTLTISSSPSVIVSSPSPSPSSSEDQSQLLCLPPLPPSPPLSPVPQSRPQSHLYVVAASPFGHQNPTYQNFSSQYPEANHVLGQIPSAWSPYSFNDEFDRIDSRQSPDTNEFQDLDVDMEEDSSDPSFYLDSNQNNFSSDFQFGFNPYFSEQPSHMEGADLDYDFESSQAQEDWLDAVLEDLMEEDEQDDSTVEYDSDDDDDDDDDNDSFRDKELDINVTRGPSSQAVVVVAHSSQEGGFLGHLLDQNGQQIIQNHHHYQHSHPIPSVPCPSLLGIDLYNSSHESPFPYQKSYLHQSFQTKEKGSTATMSTMISTSPSSTTTTSISKTSSSVTTTSDLPFAASAPPTEISMEESTLPQDHVSQFKQNNKKSSFFMDEAYYRACPPCLGFHSSSRSYPKRGQSEDALREQRFVQLTQELGAAMVKEQEVDTNTNLLLPEQQQQPFGDSFMFRSSAISPAGGSNGFLAFGH